MKSDSTSRGLPAVFGIPDDELGEKVCAIIQPHPGVALEADDVREFLEGNWRSTSPLGAFGTSNMTSDALYHAAVDTYGGAVDHGSALAAEEHDHVRDFFGLRETLIDRAGAMVLDEVLRGLID
jgi:acyl-CoA synthetase (AMP-forming)/AMP-acid ligase II